MCIVAGACNVACVSSSCLGANDGYDGEGTAGEVFARRCTWRC
jgi:hypothetical protein